MRRMRPMRLWINPFYGPPSKISVCSFILFPSVQGSFPVIECLRLIIAKFWNLYNTHLHFLPSVSVQLDGFHCAKCRLPYSTLQKRAGHNPAAPAASKGPGQTEYWTHPPPRPAAADRTGPMKAADGASWPGRAGAGSFPAGRWCAPAATTTRIKKVYFTTIHWKRFFLF